MGQKTCEAQDPGVWGTDRTKEEDGGAAGAAPGADGEARVPAFFRRMGHLVPSPPVPAPSPHRGLFLVPEPEHRPGPVATDDATGGNGSSLHRWAPSSLWPPPSDELLASLPQFVCIAQAHSKLAHRFSFCLKLS